MKVLVIGGGGREHAICYALKKSNKVSELHAMPGNPGINEIAMCHNGSVEDFQQILTIIEKEKIDFTVVGPEVPLCLGLVDFLEERGHMAFGPKKLAATLEGSKAFSKRFMQEYDIPTAKYAEVDTYSDAVKALEKFNYPLVIKADGLAAGKGVVICENEVLALNTLKELMIDKSLKDAGEKIIIEEFLTGFECSLLCFTDGNTIIPMVSAKDHKQIYDGNLGPNTGGMGTISPNPFLPEGIDKVLHDTILVPFIEGLKKANIDYRGVIFIGLMIENNVAKVLEFNVRFGDPETQSILLRLDTDLFEIMYRTAKKELDQIDIKWKKAEAGCLVLASKGYPNQYAKGLEITGLNNLGDDIVVFHAGTKMINHQLVTNGGRVLNLCCLGDNLEDIRNKLYAAAKEVHFDGKYYRNDIGLI